MRTIRIALLVAVTTVSLWFGAQPAYAPWCGEIGDTGVCTCPPGQIWKIDTGIRC